ncbi:unnamed protein product [Adineta ricciae]|uniref:Tellurite resistance methyltransferase TehB-like domain-containing protein n=1 Tax=Adineta ricciae TaxID=249248 RepID=A0A813U2R9_ADIRI|nr:unnamed protein product [Adineta ricciae]CAF1148902.1 unnamed protein product [Adineta ricciae]
MGQKRNSIWLAQKGYQVVRFDTSIEGIQIVKYQTERFNLSNLQSYVASIEEFPFEGFHWDSLSGEHRIPTGVTYRTNVIPSLFSNLTTIVYEEPDDYSDFGDEMTKVI